MINAVVLGAGRAVRFGTGRPKQLAAIAGRPLFLHALEVYRHVPGVERLLLVASRDHEAEVRSVLRDHGREDVIVVTGGATRQQSVVNALAWLDANGLAPEDLVILHNAASPNVPAELITRCLAATDTADVVQAYAPVLHTTFEVDGERMGAVLPRDRLGYSCDPTVYRVGALRKAIDWQAARNHAGESTIDAARALGIPIALVRSEHANIKVTVPWDLDALRGAMGK